MSEQIPQWAYMVAAGALLTIGQQLMAGALATLEKRLVKLETGAESEEKQRRERDHEIIKELQGAIIRIVKLESRNDHESH